MILDAIQTIASMMGVAVASGGHEPLSTPVEGYEYFLSLFCCFVSCVSNCLGG